MLLSIESVLIVFLQICAGFFISWRKWCRSEHALLFSRLGYYVFIPLLIFNSIYNMNSEELRNAASVLPTLFLSCLIMYLISFPLAKVCKVQDSRKGAFACMLMTSNPVMVGLPVATLLFGGVANQYVMIVFAVQLVMLFTCGTFSLRRDIGDETKLLSVKTLSSVIKQPPLIAILVSLPISLLQLKLPIVVTETARYLGGCAAPISLLVAGILIFYMGKKAVTLEPGMIMVVLCRFIVAPLLTFALARLFGVSTQATQVCVLLTGMPVMSNVLVVAKNMGADSDYITKCMAYTLIAMLVFIPLYQFLFTLM